MIYNHPPYIDFVSGCLWIVPDQGKKCDFTGVNVHFLNAEVELSRGEMK